MIKLDLLKYCQECPYFEADIKTEEIGSLAYTGLNTIISCKHRGMCDRLLNYLMNASTLDRLQTKNQKGDRE